MPVLAPDRAEEILANWRLGVDADGFENPAGPVFVGGYAESEITLTGTGGTYYWETCDYSQGGMICCPY